MAMGPTRFKKSVIIRKENTLTPSELELVPNGTISTKTILQGSQTAARTLTLPDISDTLVTKTTTDVLTNKSLSDTTTFIVDAVDATKKLNIDVAGTTGITGILQSIFTTAKTLIFPDASDTLIGKATSDILTNKSLSDSTSFIVDSVDNTKKLNIDVTGTTGITGVLQSIFTTAKTLILPDASDTLVGKATTDVLTNKSLSDSTSFIVDVADNTKKLNIDVTGTTGITGVLQSIFTTAKTLILPDASDTLIGKATTDILTNKSLSDTTTFIVDSVDNTKKLNIDVTGTTGVTGVLQSIFTTAKILILPDASDTLVGKATSDVLTNKTLSGNIAVTLISGAATVTLPIATGTLATLAGTEILTNKDHDGATASNTSRFTTPKAAKTVLDALTRKQGTLLYDTTSNKPYYDDGTNLKVVGSGSGGAKNYITGGDAEAGTTGFVTYANAAGTRPVDGTGGAANVTWTVSSTTPLADTNSFIFTKDAVNRQGQGVGYAFTIDSKDKAKVLQISMSYLVDSGTFVAGTSTTDSDLIAYIYDVTNAVLIEPSSFKFLSNSTTIADQFNATFQTASNSTSYRLILHVASVSALAYTLKFDTISVSPSTYAYGTPITNPTAYTPVLGSFGNGIGYLAWERRGARIKIQGALVVGATLPTGVFTLALPTGLSADYSTMPKGVVNADSYQSVGVAQVYATNKNFTAKIIRVSTSGTTFQFHGDGSTYGGAGDWGAAVPVTFAAGDTISIDIEVPILGWSSSVQTSDQTDTRVVAMKASGLATGTIGASINIVVYPTIDKDTHGSYNATTGIYTVGVAGHYHVTGGFGLSGTEALNTLEIILINIGGAAQFTNQIAAGGAITASRSLAVSGTSIFLTAGTQIYIQSYSAATTPAYINTGAWCYFTVARVSGPNQIAASESVNASYYVSANFAASTTIPINYDTKVHDSHGAVTVSATAWKFTAPINGLYEINTWSLATAVVASWISVYLGGVANRRIAYADDLGARPPTGIVTMRMLAGEYIDIRPLTAITLVGQALLSNGPTYINIKKVGQ